MTGKKMFMASLIAGLLCSSASYATIKSNLTDNKIVRDKRGNPIRSSEFGTCVRTKWETVGNTNPCGLAEKNVAVREKPEREKTQARMLKTSERTVYFDFDEDKLDYRAKKRLDHIAETLKGSDDVLGADIVGFADKIGNDSYNLALSKRRAKSVKSYLAEKGYIETRITKTRGLGEEKSITSCTGKTSAQLINCLRPDRRVEIEVRFVDEVTVYH